MSFLMKAIIRPDPRLVTFGPVSSPGKVSEAFNAVVNRCSP
jgi:hypothetical protein